MAAAIPGLLGWWAAGLRVGLIAVFAVVLAAASVYWYGERIVAGLVGAEELPRGERPRCGRPWSGWRRAAGSRRRRSTSSVTASRAPGRPGAGRSGSAVGVSQGLLQALPPAELDGVLAHEIAHIRTRDVLVQTPAVVVAAALVEFTRIGGFVSRALLFVLGPIASAIVNALLSPKREFVADAFAADDLRDARTGSPTRSSGSSWRASSSSCARTPRPRRCSRSTRSRRAGCPALFATQPPPADRIERLRALDPDWPERLRAASDPRRGIVRDVPRVAQP